MRCISSIISMQRFFTVSDSDIFSPYISDYSFDVQKENHPICGEKPPQRGIVSKYDPQPETLSDEPCPRSPYRVVVREQPDGHYRED